MNHSSRDSRDSIICKILVPVLVLASAITAQPTQKSTAPTKQAAIEVLRKMLAARDSRNYRKAASYFQLSSNETLEQKARSIEEWHKRDLPRIAEGEDKTFTAEDINILERTAVWGLMSEVAKRDTKDKGVPIEKCYSLKCSSAGAGFYWTGKEFKILYLDDIADIDQRCRKRKK